MINFYKDKIKLRIDSYGDAVTIESEGGKYYVCLYGARQYEYTHRKSATRRVRKELKQPAILQKTTLYYAGGVSVELDLLKNWITLYHFCTILAEGDKACDIEGRLKGMVCPKKNEFVISTQSDIRTDKPNKEREIKYKRSYKSALDRVRKGKSLIHNKYGKYAR